MSKRVHWSFDGTLAYLINTGTAGRSQLSQTSMNIADGDDAVSYSFDGNNWNGIAFNFPSSIQVDKIALLLTQTRTFTVEISNDSTNGLNGTWTPVLTSAGYTTPNILQSFEPTNTACVWLRLVFTSSSAYFYKSVFIFGEYVSPRFEFWNSAGDAELTSNYPMVMANAPNHETYAGSQAFRLKNIEGNTHSYSLTIKAVKYGGDTVITNNFKLSTDSGQTKNATVTISNLANNAVSGVINIYGDVTVPDNPADGYHYFVVEVTETA